MSAETSSDAHPPQPDVPALLKRLDAVRATADVNEIKAGDEGTVVARWAMPTVSVRWDKDGLIRRIHRNRLALIQTERLNK